MILLLFLMIVEKNFDQKKVDMSFSHLTYFTVFQRIDIIMKELLCLEIIC